MEERLGFIYSELHWSSNGTFGYHLFQTAAKVAEIKIPAAAWSSWGSGEAE